MDFQVETQEKSMNICFEKTCFSHIICLMDFGSILDGLRVGLGGQFGPHMGLVGANLGQLEANLGPTWSNMGQVGANLGPSGIQLGANLSQLGATWPLEAF